MSLMDTMGQALVQGMVSNMNPMNTVVIDSLKASSRNTSLELENRKGEILDGLYAQLAKLSSLPEAQRSPDLHASLQRRIKIIEQI